MPIRWILITGEYPPAAGGVSDYTQLLARALAAAGDLVEVWAPAAEGEAPRDEGVTVRRLPDHFGPKALLSMTRWLPPAASGARLLVQYVPHAFGWRAMNLPFCLWLLVHRSREPWVMFHEVAFPWGREQPIRHNLLGLVTRAMAIVLVRAAARVFVSSQRWTGLLRDLAAPRCPAVWLPVPSNVPTKVGEADIQRLRAELGAPASQLIGHFGAYDPICAADLATVLDRLLSSDPHRRLLLMGRGSSAFAMRLAEPGKVGRQIIIRQDAPAESVSLHLAACDLMIQPYGDGVSTRRGTAMAGLALACALITNSGAATEAIWKDSGAVALAENVAGMKEIAEILLADSERRQRLGARGAEVYAEYFAISHTVETLRELAEST